MAITNHAPSHRAGKPMAQTGPTLCLLLNGPTVPAWQADALDHLLSNTDTTVTAVGYNGGDTTRRVTETLRRAVELREWAVVSSLNRLIRTDSSTDERVPLMDLCDLSDVTERTIEPTPVDGWKQRLPAEPVEALASEATVCVRLGFGFIIGPVLTAFEHGVLSYHHGDLRRYRGQPMGFWEFIEGAETAGVTVQQLTDELDAGRVAALKSVSIGDCRTWEAVRRQLFAASADMLTEAVRTAIDGDTWTPETLGTLRSLPKGVPVARFAVKNTLGHLRERVGSESPSGPGASKQ